MRLDLDLSPQLVLHAFLLHLRLEEHLQSHDHLQLPLARQIHVTELPLPQRTADVEVSDGELPEGTRTARSSSVLQSCFQYTHLNLLKSGCIHWRVSQLKTVLNTLANTSRSTVIRFLQPTHFVLDFTGTLPGPERRPETESINQSQHYLKKNMQRMELQQESISSEVT